MRRFLGKLSRRSRIADDFRKYVKTKFPRHFYFPSYSQWGEDALISQFIYGDRGVYVDVGSGHPIQGNNTYFLYQRGFSGVLVDPIKKNIEQARKWRPLDSVVHSLVGHDSELVTFYEFQNYGISTTQIKRANSLQSAGFILADSYSMMSRTLTDILEENLVPKAFDLLSCDVEGEELNVLKSLDFEKYEPKVICVEELMLSPSADSELRSFLSSVNYELVISAWNSHIFLRKS
jgi:FkbM family methyltransferase